MSNTLAPSFGLRPAMAASPLQNGSFGYGPSETEGHSPMWYIAILAVVFCAVMCAFTSSDASCDKPNGITGSVASYVQDTKAATACMIKSVVGSSDYDKTCPIAKQCGGGSAQTYAPYNGGGMSRGSQDMNLHDMIAGHAAGSNHGQKYQQTFGSGVHQAMSTSLLTGYNAAPSAAAEASHHTNNLVAQGFSSNMGGSHVIGPQTVFSVGDARAQQAGSTNASLAMASLDHMQQSLAKHGVISPIG